MATATVITAPPQNPKGREGTLMAAQKAAEKNSRQIKAQQAMLCDNLSFAAARPTSCCAPT